MQSLASVRFCMAAVEEEDPANVRAAQILVSLRCRKLRTWPEWVPMQPSGEASSFPPWTVASAATAKVMSSGEAASVPLRTRQPERVSVQHGVASFAGTAVAAGVPERWPKAKRTGARGGETSREQQGHAAAAAKGSGAPRPSEQERCSAEMAAAPAQRQPVVAALCYAAVAVAGPGTGPSSTSAARAKEPMKTSSPNSPLDYGAAGRSGAPSSADDAALARPQAKRKGIDARGSVGGECGEEGCSSPSKRVTVVVEEEKSMPISVEPSVQSETGASSGKGAPRPFDLNLLPCPLDEDDDGCPDTT